MLANTNAVHFVTFLKKLTDRKSFFTYICSIWAGNLYPNVNKSFIGQKIPIYKSFNSKQIYHVTNIISKWLNFKHQLPTSTLNLYEKCNWILCKFIEIKHRQLATEIQITARDNRIITLITICSLSPAIKLAKCNFTAFCHISD